VCKRTDQHCFTNLNPADYEWITDHDLEHGPGAFVSQTWSDYVLGESEHKRTIRALNFNHAEYVYCKQLVELEGVGVYAMLGKCDHCGQSLRYCNVFYHKPSGGYLCVGNDCCHRLSLASREQLESLKLYKFRQQFKKAWQQWLEVNPAFVILGDIVEDSTIQDIMHRGRSTGKLSDKARDYLAVRATWFVERAVSKAKEALEPKSECLTGRIQVKGQILSVKHQDSQWGGSYKMLVKDYRGFKVWGNIPSEIDANVGDVVEFTATVEKSDKDESFGFYKRPSKAKTIS
jgi:hypothetical protein